MQELLSEAGHILGHVKNRPQHDGWTQTIPITPYDTIIYPCQRHRKSKSSPRPCFFAAQAKTLYHEIWQSTARNNCLGVSLYSISCLDKWQVKYTSEWHWWHVVKVTAHFLLWETGSVCDRMFSQDNQWHAQLGNMGLLDGVRPRFKYVPVWGCMCAISAAWSPEQWTW